MVMTSSNNPARSTPILDFFFGFSGGGSLPGAGAEEVAGVGSSGGGTMRESELVINGTDSSVKTGGVGGPPTGGGAGSIGSAGTGFVTGGGTGGAVTSEGGTVPDGDGVLD